MRSNAATGRASALASEVSIGGAVQEADEDNGHVVAAQAPHLAVGRQAAHHQLFADLGEGRDNKTSLLPKFLMLLSQDDKDRVTSCLLLFHASSPSNKALITCPSCTSASLHKSFSFLKVFKKNHNCKDGIQAVVSLHLFNISKKISKRV